MSKPHFLILCFLSSATAIQAQSNFLTQFDQNLTPSPMIASLGNYGGVDVKKSSGGVSKRINLLEIRQGDLSYTPSINYFSTGVRVDDWGSRVGIGWTENIMPVITRVVKGIPDERAGSRTEDVHQLFGDNTTIDVSAAALNKIKALAAHNTSIDGQFDLFTYNLMELSGQFIIKNNQAVLLSPQDNVKIDIVVTSPTYGFTLTTPDGVKYDFSLQRETTKFNSENACDIDNPNRYDQVATAWFASKMISPTGSTIYFEYSDVSFSYIYDYTESYQYTSYNNRPLPCTRGDEEGDMYNGYENSKISCLRRKTTTTKMLNTVTGDNFIISYDYIGRNDIRNERLLKAITLSNGSKILRSMHLEYDEFLATAPFETALADNLDVSDVETEKQSLNTRYFLKSLMIENGGQSMGYKFGYITPAILPHHFSFSQDYMGCYNGKVNAGLVPKNAMKGLEGLGISYSFADRRTSIVGSAGLLNRIEYPTGGSDTIVYEQNRFKTTVLTDHPASTWDWFGTGEEQSYEGWFFTMNVPVQCKVDIVLECFLEEGSPPTDPDMMENYAKIQLWGPDGQMNFPRIGNEIDLRLGQARSTTFYINGVPASDGQLEFFPGEEYNLFITLWGEHTALKATLYYTEGLTSERIDSVFAGYRISKIITRSNTNNNLIRSYDYNHFDVKDGQLTLYPDSSSLVVAPADNHRAIGINLCYDWNYYPNLPPALQHQLRGVFPYETYRLLPNSNKNINIFGGLPYSYQQITEFLDSSRTSFIASNYKVSPNGFSGWLNQYYETITAVNPEMENFAWDHAIELERFTGTKSGSKYNILKEEQWRYSTTESKHYNYSAGQIAQPLYSQDNIGNYIINYHDTYSIWKKLDTIAEIIYSRDGTTLSSLKQSKVYKYNSNDKNVEEVTTYDSKGNMVTERILHPYKMVASGFDPTGVYQSMINANYQSPVIESINLVAGQQTSRQRMHYSIYNGSMFLSDSMYAQSRTSDPMELRAVNTKYDRKGNLVEKQLTNNVKTSYLWGYNGQYPVARIVGSDFNTVNARVDTALLNNGSTAQIAAQLATLRQSFASDASVQVFTYLYEPLVGMISETDQAGRIFTYEYDELNRLKIIRDQNNRIIKQYCYNYAGQPEKCQ